MKILNVHHRSIAAPKEQLQQLMLTLATKSDQVWPQERWPAMRFRDGLQIGAKGGHGPIRYTIEEYRPGEWIKFRFSTPAGFNGHHYLAVEEKTAVSCVIRHTIEMKTNFLATFKWLLAIRPLHNALIEDAFDKVENRLTGDHKKTSWSPWVRFLRWLLK